MLSGRFSRRRGIQLLVGCFIVFGSFTLASGIMRALKAGGSDAQVAPAEPPMIAATPVAPPPAVTVPYDPYAGAALPPRR